MQTRGENYLQLFTPANLLLGGRAGVQRSPTFGAGAGWRKARSGLSPVNYGCGTERQ
jgi:hypothetical protein